MIALFLTFLSPVFAAAAGGGGEGLLEDVACDRLEELVGIVDTAKTGMVGVKECAVCPAYVVVALRRTVFET